MFERIRAKLCVYPFSRRKCVPIEKINNLSRIINYYLEPLLWHYSVHELEYT